MLINELIQHQIPSFPFPNETGLHCELCESLKDIEMRLEELKGENKEFSDEARTMLLGVF